MRHNFPRDFYLPKTDTLLAVDCEGTDATVYVYEKAGALYAIGFHGRANKPDFHYRYSKAEARAKAIADFLEGRKQRAAYMTKRKTEQRAPHPLKVGVVLHTNWGYDQTNVEYFEVTRVVGPHTVELREIAQEREETGFMSGRCRPIPGRYLSPRYEGDDTGKPIIRRARGDGTVKIDNVRTAWVGAGELRWSSYA